MKALIADRIATPCADLLREAGIEVIYDPDLSGDALAAAVEDTRADALAVRSTRVSADVLRAGGLKLVVRAGAGFDTIDADAATALGVQVANCPGSNAAAVAELAFGLMIALDRRIPDNVADLRAGRWNKRRYSEARGLRGATLALLGTGAAGRAMIQPARAFGMNVIAWSRSLTPKKAAALGVEWRETPQDAARDADVLSVHLALTSETRRLVNADLLSAMKRGAYLINTSRAEIVDEAALADAVRAKGLRAGVDVFEGEPSAPNPSPVENPLFALPDVIGTHHVGGATAQAHRAVAEETARSIIQFAQTGKAANLVNPPSATDKTDTTQRAVGASNPPKS